MNKKIPPKESYADFSKLKDWIPEIDADSDESVANDEYWFNQITERMWEISVDYEVAKKSGAAQRHDTPERSIADMMRDLAACEKEFVSHYPEKFEGVVKQFTGIDLCDAVDIGHLGIAYSSTSMRELSQLQYDVFVVHRLHPLLNETFGGLKSFTRSDRAQLDVDYWGLARLDDGQYSAFLKTLSEALLALFAWEDQTPVTHTSTIMPSDEQILTHLRANNDRNIRNSEKLKDTWEWLKWCKNEKQRHPEKKAPAIRAALASKIANDPYDKRASISPHTIRHSITSLEKAIKTLRPPS